MGRLFAELTYQGDEVDPRGASTSPSSSTFSKRSPRLTRRSPRSTSGPERSCSSRSSTGFSFDYDAFVRESFIELRMQPKTTPHQTLAVLRARGGAAHHAVAVSRLERQHRPPLHGHVVPRPHRGGGALAGRAPIPPRRRWTRSRIACPSRGCPIPCGTSSSSAAHPGSTALRKFSQFVPPPDAGVLGEQVRAVGHHVHGELRVPEERHPRRLHHRRLPRPSAAGVCQDFTHLMLGLLRLRGVPCRYVSGYLHVPPAARRGGAEPCLDRVLLADPRLDPLRPHPRSRRSTSGTSRWATAGATRTSRPTRASSAATPARRSPPRSTRGCPLRRTSRPSARRSRPSTCRCSRRSPTGPGSRGGS